MNKIRLFLTLTGYQLTWLSCVFGESKFNLPFLGIIVGTTFIVLYFYFSKNKFSFLKISLRIFIPGYIFDTLMVYFAIYEFNSSMMFGTLPTWMLTLWISFSTLFDEILCIFKKYKYTGIFLSGLLGPITYYLGKPIGIISINHEVLFILLMVIFWVSLMIYYISYVLKKN